MATQRRRRRPRIASLPPRRCGPPTLRMICIRASAASARASKIPCLRLWRSSTTVTLGQTLTLKGREFVEAAQAMGVSTRNIILRHVVPNLLGVVVVYVTLTIPRVILVESFLSFLGLGVQEPSTSWGALVNEGAREMESSWWTLAFPASFLAITLFCFNFVGDGLRDALDPKDR